MREHNYKKLVRECDVINTQSVAGLLTNQNSLGAVVIQNIMQVVIDDAEKLNLGGGDYNVALIFRVMTGLQNVLDAVARYCDDQYPSAAPKADDDRVYFERYSFEREEVHKIHYFQRKIAALSFRGKTFYDILKQDMPWVGLNNSVDILDNEHIGLVYDMIVPVLNHTISIVHVIL
jgi:hypothetical protein